MFWGQLPLAVTKDKAKGSHTEPAFNLHPESEGWKNCYPIQTLLLLSSIFTLTFSRDEIRKKIYNVLKKVFCFFKSDPCTWFKVKWFQDFPFPHFQILANSLLFTCTYLNNVHNSVWFFQLAIIYLLPNIGFSFLVHTLALPPCTYTFSSLILLIQL